VSFIEVGFVDGLAVDIPSPGLESSNAPEVGDAVAAEAAVALRVVVRAVLACVESCMSSLPGVPHMPRRFEARID